MAEGLLGVVAGGSGTLCRLGTVESAGAGVGVWGCGLNCGGGGTVGC